MKAEIGIIGGTGVYDSSMLTKTEEIKFHTPYGSPSDLLKIGEIKGKKIAFIPRHSNKHTINPSNVNYRANIYALMKLDVKYILAPAAVGSLNEKMEPGNIVFVDQFIDRTYRRMESFYEGSQVCHISVAEPLCKTLRKSLIESAKKLKILHHSKGTYVCIEGPRYSTKAESNMFRMWGADVIGMTLVPECVLAREAEICYASIATVTDFDVWKEGEVSTEEVVKTMKENVSKVKRIIVDVIEKLPLEKICNCDSALKDALM
jgi:5'-methylthioadenosine phosphorylase